MINHSVDKLPSTLNPRKTANQDREIVGQLPISAFERAKPLIENTDGVLTMSLIVVFEDNQLQMRGSIETTLLMTCQRCLKPMSVKIDSEFACVIVKDEEASKALPAYIDGYVCEERILLHELAEDELLLAMPLSPKHDECDADFENEIESVEATHNPFADLKNLIKPN